MRFVQIDHHGFPRFPIFSPENAVVPGNINKADIAPCQCAPALLSYLSQLAGESDKVFVFISPRIGAAVKGIFIALLSRFVAIVNAGNAGKEKL